MKCEKDVKNLLVITNWFPSKGTSFSSPFVYEFVKSISKYVDNVYVISLNPYVPSIFRRKRILDLLKLNNRWHMDILSPFYGKDYKLDNIEVYYVTYKIPPYSVFADFAIKGLVNKVKGVVSRNKLKFDLIHAHFTWPAGYVAVKLGKEYGTPSIITIHENGGWFLKEYKSRSEKIYWAWKNANALIRVNQKDIPLLKEFNFNVFPVPNGFDPKRLPVMDKGEARLILGLSPNNKVLLSLGILIERKGFQYLIDAISVVARERNNVACYIGGSGPLKERLQKRINELGLQKHVKLLGFVPDEELALWMNAADLFVLPSLSEGNPTVMFEALGVGLPFVGTAVGGVPEIITSEDYGLLCPPTDPECLAEKILIALEKEWDREKIRKYAEQFTWENIARAVLRIYRKILGDEV